MKKIAVVTGADRGLGISLTRWLLENGYKVFAGQFMESCDFLKEMKALYPEDLELVPLDVGKDESVQSAARMIAAKATHIDLIINNAGISHQADQATILEKQNYEVMQEIYNVNTLGTLRVTNSLMELLLQGSTKLVVNISSEAGSVEKNKRTNMYGYCMSKSAMNMQSSILHQHLRTFGGQVMVFYPGWLQSYMSGTLNEEAPTTTDESAHKIMNLVKDHKTYMADQPIFLDIDGKKWPW
ncbi:SDR family NAD(P)-dependent oxidoreductase [Bacillus sp. FSL K6-3431]|uniref:SDR family NAD(P)-dependent oxidoreductase n=1 Tax=Bacillus sp. FSL K6-3431 TaxID=2921500 RepID=UPI0030F89451